KIVYSKKIASQMAFLFKYYISTSMPFVTQFFYGSMALHFCVKSLRASPKAISVALEVNIRTCVTFPLRVVFVRLLLHFIVTIENASKFTKTEKATQTE